MKRLLIISLLCTVSISLLSAPGANLWEFWDENNPSSSRELDHTPFARFLDTYLVEADGINRIRYGEVTASDKSRLDTYINGLTGLDPRSLSSDEQMAYWINLYNVLTIQVILDHYPVDSIRKIRLTGLFSGGPWDKKLVTIAGQEVSLNDIEHRILRPIWKDHRIHYAVNCASLGCPNIWPKPYTADTLEQILSQAEKAYVNHPRGVKFDGSRLILSSIYDWYVEDFADSTEELLEYLASVRESPTQQPLGSFDGRIRYEYDWSLNDAP